MQKKRSSPPVEPDSSSSSEDSDEGRQKRSKSVSPPVSSLDVEMEDLDAQSEQEAELLSPGNRLTQLQREATDWMAEREVDAGGGLLTDEMGLGKTLSTLYRIASYKLENPCNPGQTLVVCPPILFDTWEGEVEKRFRPGLLRVARYGASDDRSSVQDAKEGRVNKKADIILTSYNRLFMDLEAHLDRRPPDNADPEDKRTMAEVLLSERHYRKSDRATLLSRRWLMNKIDPSLVTVSEPLAPRGLFSVKWTRVVLDEAHKACNAETKTFAAAMCLAADFRWWVTGTPIQNKYADAVSALLFVREPGVCKEIPDAPPREVRLDDKMTDQEWRAHRVFTRWAKGRNIQQLLDQREDLVRNDPVLRYMAELEFNTFEHAVAFKHEAERAAHLKHVRRLRRVAQLLADKGGDGLAATVSYDVKRQLAPLDAKEEAAVSEEVAEMLASGRREGDILLAFYLRARQVCVDLTLAGEPPLPGGALSTKLQLLVDDVKSRVAQDEKFIVFSGWVEALEKASAALDHRGVRTVMLHGKMSVQKRREALARFKEEKNIRGICMQIDCGGLGLTITEANRIYQLEPELNPQREKQAFGRIRRPGQTKNMSVTYLLIARSIEEIVRSTAAKKLRISAKIQGRGDRASLSSLEVLRDVNLLLLSTKDDPAYRERDGELEYRQGLEERRSYEIPPGFEVTLTRKQITDKIRIYLGAFAAYNSVRTIPSASVVWRLTTRHKDLAERFRRKSVEETRLKEQQGAFRPAAPAPPTSSLSKPAATPFLSKPSIKGASVTEAPVDSLAVALDPLKLRRWLNDDFFKLFRAYEAERVARASNGFGDLYTRSNYNELETMVDDQVARLGYASLDPTRAHLPSDFLRLITLMAKPALVVHYTQEALVADRQAYGAYDARSAGGDLVSIRGDAASRLRESTLYAPPPSGYLQLDVKVLVSFMPLFLDPTLSAMPALPSAAFGAQIFSRPSDLWTEPPPVPAADTPPFEPRIMNRSAAGRDGLSFMRDVRELLLPAVAQASRDGDSALVTCILAMLLLVPSETDSVERRLFVAQSSSTGSILGVASAIVIRNASVRPNRPVVAIVAPSVYVGAQFRGNDEAQRVLSVALGRALSRSLFDPVAYGNLSYASQPDVDPDTGRIGTRFRTRLITAMRGYVAFLEMPKELGAHFEVQNSPAAALNWPVETGVYTDGTITWRISDTPATIAEPMEFV